MDRSTPSAFSRGGTLQPSIYADVRYIDDVIAICMKAWNGEGFNFNLDPAYWLVDVSGFIHGIPCDRLGGPDAIKGMLFGNYERNSASAAPIWKFWDAVEIQDAAMVGWWEEDAPVKAVVPPPTPTPPPPPPQQCISNFTRIAGSYYAADGGPSGVIGFGSDCGPPGSNQKYPKLTVAQAKADCCALGDGCVGFDWVRKDRGRPACACAWLHGV